VQLAIRLLVPQGSYLLQLPGFAEHLQRFDPSLLGYPWQHADERVDALQQQIMATTMQLETAPRDEAFNAIWELAHAAVGLPAPSLAHADFGETIARLSEPWYCCAEPTDQQLQSF
jgi:hypothetical protein